MTAPMFAASPKPRPSLELQRLAEPPKGESERRPKSSILKHIPLCIAIILILSPHPSLLIVLVKFHLLVLKAPVQFAVHLLAVYTLTFLAFSSLIVCVARDPGPVKKVFPPEADQDRETMSLTEALMTDDDASDSRDWCFKCSAPKPPRTHHCSVCGRCVLKMDHHCPWIASKCIGHRTYPAFLHFLCSLTLLSIYIAIIAISAFIYALNNPLAIDVETPIHELCLAMAGLVFSFVMGSFTLYHIYLVCTNQTTLENLNPFILLRHLPPLPYTSNDRRHLSDPPLEHELSYAQRRAVMVAHKEIRLYDVGLRKNVAQVFGWEKKWGWAWRLLVGGGGKGDGRTFPLNPRANKQLALLAAGLVEVGKDD